MEEELTATVMTTCSEEPVELTETRMTCSEEPLELIETRMTCSENTKRTYKMYLRKFLREMGENASLEDIKAYLKKTYTEINTRRIVSIIINLFVLKPKNLELLPVSKRSYKGKSTKANVLLGDECDFILNISKNFYEDSDLYFCVQLLRMTGMRISELLRVTKTDVIEACKKDPCSFSVQGKGKCMRDIFILPRDRDFFVNEFVPYVLSKESEKIFLTKYHNMRNKLKRAMVSIGMYDNKKKGFHALRSMYATNVYRDLMLKQEPYAKEVLKQLLGHKSFKTTREYIRPQKDHVVDIVNSLV